MDGSGTYAWWRLGEEELEHVARVLLGQIRIETPSTYKFSKSVGATYV